MHKRATCIRFTVPNLVALATMAECRDHGYKKFWGVGALAALGYEWVDPLKMFPILTKANIIELNLEALLQRHPGSNCGPKMSPFWWDSFREELRIRTRKIIISK